MRNITLSANEHLIETAREKARERKTTLNAEFRKWLQRYANTEQSTQQRINTYKQLMEDLSAVSTAGRHFTRDEMNERR